MLIQALNSGNAGLYENQIFFRYFYKASVTWRSRHVHSHAVRSESESRWFIRHSRCRRGTTISDKARAR
jgi:hypothetical protein